MAENSDFFDKIPPGCVGTDRRSHGQVHALDALLTIGANGPASRCKKTAELYEKIKEELPFASPEEFVKNFSISDKNLDILQGADLDTVQTKKDFCNLFVSQEVKYAFADLRKDLAQDADASAVVDAIKSKDWRSLKALLLK